MFEDGAYLIVRDSGGNLVHGVLSAYDAEARTLTIIDDPDLDPNTIRPPEGGLTVPCRSICAAREGDWRH